jgi:hypothetical protein
VSAVAANVPAAPAPFKKLRRGTLLSVMRSSLGALEARI